MDFRKTLFGEVGHGSKRKWLNFVGDLDRFVDSGSLFVNFCH